MRTTVILDDALLEKAQRLTGIAERTALIQEGLRALVERESARRLSRLGGEREGAEASATSPRRMS